MEVSNLLSHEPAATYTQATSRMETTRKQMSQQPYSSLQTSPSAPAYNAIDGYTTPPSNLSHQGSQGSTPTHYHLSPQSCAVPKYVAFELLFPDSPNYRARLPMRVNIFPHDTTDSIITTVRNFYGLYEGPGGPKGISFEDENGTTLIARYENFGNNMTVYVRVILDPEGSPTAYQPPSNHSGSPVDLHSEHKTAPLPRPPPQQPSQVLTYGQPPSRPSSRTARMRSGSPHSGRGRTMGSAIPKLGRSRSGVKSRGSSAHATGLEQLGDAMYAYSSDEGDHGSTASSRKARSEQLASAEISLDNIVEGGRRKRAKFESSELPLFVPPQVPLTASMSSMSPVRQGPSPYNLKPLTDSKSQYYPYGQALPSPQSLNNKSTGNELHRPAPVFPPPSAPPNRRLRNRNSAPVPAVRYSNTPNGARPSILPTPDPTVASTISDEDVALQLMRLGDTSMISNTTRNSASTLDDALSGVADVASSVSDSSASDDEGDDEQPLQLSHMDIDGALPLKANEAHDRVLPGPDASDLNDADYEDSNDQTYVDGNIPRSDLPIKQEIRRKTEKSKSGVGADRRSETASVKSGKIFKARSGTSGKGKASSALGPSASHPASPSALTNNSAADGAATAVNFQQTLGEDEEDLSSKPRCQRCRKSKKGCDRQRPCQRCKDAGLSVDDCISEDEGNGRKGRYGRHMGVVVKKQATAPMSQDGSTGLVLASSFSSEVTTGEKSRKRKR